jgi:hypothetical protein
MSGFDFEIGPRGNRIPKQGNQGGDSDSAIRDSYTSFENTPLNTSLYSSFSGSDITATVIIPGQSSPITFATLRTISYSIVRDKRPLRLLGSMNPVTWSKSNRLIAGTLVFTSFDRYVWFQLTGNMFTPQGIVLADMLPPFDVTITALNEYGQTSRLTIRGVRIVDEGAVIGVDDMYVEQTHTYVAQDIIPWIPAPDDEEDEVMK